MAEEWRTIDLGMDENAVQGLRLFARSVHTQPRQQQPQQPRQQQAQGTVIMVPTMVPPREDAVPPRAPLSPKHRARDTR